MNYRSLAPFVLAGTVFACTERTPIDPEAAGLRLDVRMTLAALAPGDTAVIRAYLRNVSAEPRVLTVACASQLLVVGADGMPVASTCPGTGALVQDTLAPGATDSTSVLWVVRAATGLAGGISGQVTLCDPVTLTCRPYVGLRSGQYVAYARFRSQGFASLQSADVALDVP